MTSSPRQKNASNIFITSDTNLIYNANAKLDKEKLALDISTMQQKSQGKTFNSTFCEHSFLIEL
jgi:hypothetical protein